MNLLCVLACKHMVQHRQRGGGGGGIHSQVSTNSGPGRVSTTLNSDLG